MVRFEVQAVNVSECYIYVRHSTSNNTWLYKLISMMQSIKACVSYRHKLAQSQKVMGFHYYFLYMQFAFMNIQFQKLNNVEIIGFPT